MRMLVTSFELCKLCVYCVLNIEYLGILVLTGVSYVSPAIIDACYVFFSGQLEVTVDFLVEIDKLVQLIESPIFTCKLELERKVKV
jgi:hypothetical protein